MFWFFPGVKDWLNLHVSAIYLEFSNLSNVGTDVLTSAFQHFTSLEYAEC